MRKGLAAALCLGAVVIATSLGAESEPGVVEYPSWLVADDPTDETIRHFWERAEMGELDAESLVDLGTLIFDRGHPDEAIGFYKQALDVDSSMYEAWFRIGLVEHTRGDLDKAEQAYSRCLKKRPGHAWCNFYYGLLEEQLGHASKALKHYEAAFAKAPRLTDPAFNPEILSSRLALAAQLRTHDGERFEQSMPMRLLRPDQVNEVRRSFEVGTSAEALPPADEPQPEADAVSGAPAAQPTPVAPTAEPVTAPPPRRVPTRPPATPAPSGSGAGGGSDEVPYGAPVAPIGNTSNEAMLRPGWSGLWRLADRLV